MTQRTAAHQIVVGDQIINMGVVETCNGLVKSYYQLDTEMPMTVWMGGVIVLKEDEEGNLRAYKNEKLII